jgi:hypothetical protein
VPDSPQGNEEVGWKTYTYGKVAISIPQSWAVVRDIGCPDSQAPGTLELDWPKVPTQCALIPLNATWVIVTAYEGGEPPPSEDSRTYRLN